MFIVRGVNVYPSAILAVVGRFRPRVTGRARVVRNGAEVSVEPPVPVEVEVIESHAGDAALKEAIEREVRAALTFRCIVELVSETDFGEAGYKTRLVRRT
jgi:phenylacetate-coenzyme A ligase PaaK-like adenylate-forming protein